MKSLFEYTDKLNKPMNVSFRYEERISLRTTLALFYGNPV